MTTLIDPGVTPATGVPEQPEPVRLESVLQALDTAVSAAATIAVGDVPGPVAGEAAVRLVAVLRRLEALNARLLCRFDASGEWAAEGFRSPASWLAARSTVGLPAARASARLADRLLAFPAMAASFAAGRVGADHLTVLADAHRCYPRLTAALADIEPEIAAYAERVDAATLRTFLARRLHQIDPDAADDAEAARRRRESYLTAREYGDGWVKVDGVLPPEVGLAFTAALDAAVRDVSVESEGETTPGDGTVPGGSAVPGGGAGPDRAAGRDGAAGPERSPVGLRTRRRRNVEGLLRLLAAAGSALGPHRLPDVRGQRPVIAVTVPVEVFVAASAGCGRPVPAALAAAGARIGGGVAVGDTAVVSMEAARRLACDAELRRLIVDPAGLVLDVGRATRTVSP